MGSSASRYIVSPPIDWLLIVGAPLLCAGVLLSLARVYRTEDLFVVVMALGAVGHHLPGFLRTYGDQGLWKRFRVRFLVAPPLVFATALTFSTHELSGVLLMSQLWSVWHGMMQHYGFVRIYDAKDREPGQPGQSARLDWLLAATWFSACVAWSPTLGATLLDALGRAGVGLPSAQALGWVRTALGAAAVGVAGWYALGLLSGRGGRAGGLKLGLVLLTSAVVYGCRVVTTDIYLATALFELLHDTQYLTIVWAFNQSRQRSGTALRPFRGRLFAPGPRGALLYVGLCLAYGALAFGPRVLEAHSLVKQVVEAWLVTSGLLHFYFDGFIWKVREADIGATLSLDPAALPQTVRAAWGSPGVRAVAHAACWVAIAGALFGLEQRAVAGDALTRTQRMVELVPDNTTAQGELGFLLLNQGRFADARPHLARALELMPDQPNVESNLGVVELNLGHPETALGMLDRARRHAAGRARIDGLERNRGDVLMVLNQPGEAKASFLLALDETPGDPDVLLRLALSQARLGAPAEALRSLDQALARNPALVEAHFVRGEVLNQLGRVDDGRAALERALQLDPGFAPARHLLARLPPP